MSQPPTEHIEALARKLEADLFLLDYSSSSSDIDLAPPNCFEYIPTDDDVQDLKLGAVKSLHDWGFEEVRTFLDERPMSLHMECFEIVDGRVLSVLTDESLQELGVSKRLHRLVLINKISKEKARSQQHTLFQATLERLVQLYRDSTCGSLSDREDLRLVPLLLNRLQDLVLSFSVHELVLELRTKALTMEIKTNTIVDDELAKSTVRRLRKRAPASEQSCCNTLRMLFILMRNEDNRATCVSEGIIETLIMVIDRSKSKVHILGLAILLSLSYSAENQAAIIKCNGVRCIVNVLSSSASSERFQEYGFRLLWLFGQDPSYHDQMIEQGVVSTAIAGMAEHRRRAGVQEYGCGLIRSLCFKVGGRQAANKARIMADGGIGAVVKGMVEHGDHAGVQEHGSAALRLMSACGEITKTLKERKRPPP